MNISSFQQTEKRPRKKEEQFVDAPVPCINRCCMKSPVQTKKTKTRRTMRTSFTTLLAT
jgi:hypothetical protein